MMEKLSLQQRQIVDQAIGILEAQMRRPGAKLNTAMDTERYLELALSRYSQQVFGCIYLDSKHRVIDDEVLFRGSLVSCLAYPRQVVQEALKRPAVNVILYRNDIEWGEDEYCIPSNIRREAKKMNGALDLIDVKLMDYLVVSGTKAHSLAALGAL